MAAFSCLAERCPDTCCRDWAVPVDRADLDRLKGAMASTPSGRDRLVRLIVIGNRTRGSDTTAQLHLDESNGCPMLEGDQRCGVHATLGEEALTTACSIFPRTALSTPSGLEVGGSLGCPEVARLTLLATEPPELGPAPRPMLPRPYVGKAIAAGGADGYARHFVDVRQTLLACFRLPLTLGTRLALAADFAARVQGFFHAGTAEMDGARRAFAERRLGAERAATFAPATRAELEADLQGLAFPAGVAGGVTATIASFLLERRRLPHSPRFAALLAQTLTATGEASAAEANHWWTTYAQRREQLHARAGVASNTLFGNYAQHFLLRNPYTDAPNLTDYLHRLAVHLGAVRLLTVLHPLLAERLAAAPDLEADTATLQRVAVDAVQVFTKAIGHHPEYLHAALNQGGPATFGRLILLAKFV
jgi:lysine-N-methylase